MTECDTHVDAWKPIGITWEIRRPNVKMFDTKEECVAWSSGLAPGLLPM